MDGKQQAGGEGLANSQGEGDGKGAQAMNLRKDFGVGRTWFNPVFVLPVLLELTLKLEQNALLQPIPL